jgi:hypothetical protein
MRQLAAGFPPLFGKTQATASIHPACRGGEISGGTDVYFRDGLRLARFLEKNGGRAFATQSR